MCRHYGIFTSHDEPNFKNAKWENVLHSLKPLEFI